MTTEFFLNAVKKELNSRRKNCVKCFYLKTKNYKVYCAKNFIPSFDIYSVTRKDLKNLSVKADNCALYNDEN